jgi:hypothetical protein
MSLFDLKKERILTAVVIVASLAGILYFGYLAIRDNSKEISKNPFEYDIESFKKSDPDLLDYSETSRIVIEMQNVYGIAVGADDRIYASGDNAVLVFNIDGTFRASIAVDGPIRCLAVDENRDIYAGMDDHIEVYDGTGVRRARWESLGEQAIITSITVSKEYVFAADAENLIVWKFDKTGNLLGRIGEKDETKDIPGFIIPSPFFDVAIDPDGFLWAANTGRHSLENYTLDGGFRTSWGEFSMEIEGFCGCCNPSHFAFLEDGSFVTSEKGIARVKVYNRLGNLVSVVAEPDQFIEGTVGLDLAVDSRQRVYVLDPMQKLIRIFAKEWHAIGEDKDG